MEDQHLTDNRTLHHKKTLLKRIAGMLKRNLLFELILLGVFIGFCVGFGIQHHNPSKAALMWIGMPGDLFLRLLKLLIFPFIVATTIAGTATVDPKHNGKVGGIAFTYFISSHVVACIIAIALCLIIKPGLHVQLITENRPADVLEPQDIFSDLLRNIFPDNIVKASFSQTRTINKEIITERIVNGTNSSTIVTERQYEKSLGEASGPNILGLIFVCTLLGIASGRRKTKTEVFISFFQGASETLTQLLTWVMWLTPAGLLSLIAAAIGGSGKGIEVFADLAVYIVTVIGGLAVITFIVYPINIIILTRRNPVGFLLSCFRPSLTTFSTASSAMGIPDMIHSCEVKNKIDPRIARFVIPLGASLNSNGSSLFITTSAFFLANISGTSLSAADILVIGLLTSICALALPAVPSSSLVLLLMITNSVGVPGEFISMLFAVEWILDRLRTTCNAINDMIGAFIVNHMCKSQLTEVISQEEENGKIIEKEEMRSML